MIIAAGAERNRKAQPVSMPRAGQRADVRAADSKGRTPLDLARKKQHLGAMQKLPSADA